MLTREALLAPHPRRVEKVDAPERGGYVFVRSLTVREELAREDASRKAGDQHAGMLVSLSYWLSDDKGERLLCDEDFDAVGNLDSRLVVKIANAAMKLNSYQDDAKKD